jgi:hypothetical protein
LHPAGYNVAFIASKCKVAPKKYVSVPRLELEAARLGSRLAQMIAKELQLKFSKRMFWTDSQTALSWIKSDHRKYKTFVANRVADILETTITSEWNWIPGRRNVADEATKKIKKIDLTPDGRWFAGPDFLKSPEEKWPDWKNEQLDGETTAELKTKYVGVHDVVDGKMFDVLKSERFSKFSRFSRTVAWIIRALYNFRRKQKPSVLYQNQSIRQLLSHVPELSSDEIDTAEFLIFRKAQLESFPNEVTLLQAGKYIDKTSKLWKLSPYMDSTNQIIKLRGRIDAAPFVEIDFKRPIILD